MIVSNPNPSIVAFLLILIVGIILADSLTFYSQITSNVRFFLNWTSIVSSASAFIMAVLVTLQFSGINKILGMKRVRHVSHNENYQSNDSNYQLYSFTPFMIGLALWFVAEMTWTYYELELDIKNPYPSIADVFWLTGYPFIIYFVIRTNSIMAKQNLIHDREFIILFSVAAALTLAYVLYITFGIGYILSNRQDVLGWIITTTYPILDVIAFVPLLLIIRKLRQRNEDLTLSWKILTAALALVTIADIGFGYSEVVGTTVQEGRTGVWDIIYSAAYTAMAASMFWQYRNLWIKKMELRSNAFG